MFKNGQVSKRVRDGIVVALWIPVVLVVCSLGLGFAIAVLGVALSVATAGTVPEMGWLTGVIDPSMVMLALGAAVWGLVRLYLMLANETFGTSTVEAAQEQADELQEDVQRGD